MVILLYRDIVECIKLNQIKQGISVKTLASRVGVHTQVITDIRGYRMKVSPVLFDKILSFPKLWITITPNPTTKATNKVIKIDFLITLEEILILRAIFSSLIIFNT